MDWRENWGNDGYAVENASTAKDGSSTYNDLRLAIAAELDRQEDSSSRVIASSVSSTTS